MSLARRITVLVLAVSLVSSLVSTAFLVGLARQATREAALSSLSRDTDLLARVVRASTGLRRNAPGLGVDALQQALQSRSVQTLVVPVGPGEVAVPFASSDLTALSGGESISLVRRVDGRNWIVEGRPAGEYVVLAAQPLDVATSFVPAPRRRAVWAAVVGAVIAAIAGVVVARGLSRPLARLGAAARRLAAGERGIRVAADGATEIADAGAALNSLSDALATSEERQRRFLLTVSHELRTPLTAVTGYAEALADGVISGEDVPAAAAVIRAEAARLLRRVEELLALARLEADDVTVESVDVDVAGLLEAADWAWAARAAAQRTEIVLQVAASPAAPLLARGDPERLRQAVDALTDNALRVLAVQPEGHPRLVVLSARSSEGSRVVVEVRDSGPGLAADELAVAFEPGVLHERYRGERPVGSGVGLALVGRLASLMGGGATATAAPEGGLAVTITLPGTRLRA